jgi:hypothetical protein
MFRYQVLRVWELPPEQLVDNVAVANRLALTGLDC